MKCSGREAHVYLASEKDLDSAIVEERAWKNGVIWEEDGITVLEA